MISLGSVHTEQIDMSFVKAKMCRSRVVNITFFDTLKVFRRTFCVVNQTNIPFRVSSMNMNIDPKQEPKPSMPSPP